MVRNVAPTYWYKHLWTAWLYRRIDRLFPIEIWIDQNFIRTCTCTRICTDRVRFNGNCGRHMEENIRKSTLFFSCRVPWRFGRFALYTRRNKTREEKKTRCKHVVVHRLTFDFVVYPSAVRVPYAEHVPAYLGFVSRVYTCPHSAGGGSHGRPDGSIECIMSCTHTHKYTHT